MNEPRTPTAGLAVQPGEERGREAPACPPGARAAGPGDVSRPSGAPT